jgi:hypothetical protein
MENSYVTFVIPNFCNSRDETAQRTHLRLVRVMNWVWSEESDRLAEVRVSIKELETEKRIGVGKASQSQ